MSGLFDPGWFFGPDGPLALERDRFEYRRGQVRMAEAVTEAFREGRHLVVEAGTGTGKTLAYLVPALKADAPVILSTGTKALQEQLIGREAPVALEATGSSRRVELLKGRENYLCKKRLEEARLQPLLEGTDELGLFKVIERWERKTETGDRSEVPGLPDFSRLWSKLDARADICVGSKCAWYEECHLVLARRRAQEAHVVVANHHLLFADLALRKSGHGQILPDAAYAVLDEAHLAEDAAAAHFGLRLSTRMLSDLASDPEDELERLGVDTEPARTLGRVGRRFLALLRPPEGRGRVALRREALDEIAAPRAELEEAWARYESAVAGPGERGEERALLVARCRTQAAALGELLLGESLDHVVTVESQGKRGAVLASFPIEVGELLAETMGQHFASVVAASATLSVEGRLDRAAGRLGIPKARKLIVPSPFDPERQAGLYIPRKFPDPKEFSFGERCLDEIEELLQITEGRALVVFASHRALRRAADELAPRLPWRVLVQGDAPRERLVDEFRNDVHSVLFGTASFRQGIDVPGEALSLVIVDKLPFAVPDDPLVAARADACRRRGGNPFMADQLPEAILALKQALGRLIRTRRDRGLLVVLDSRIRTRRYGDVVLRSLPPWPLFEERHEAARWYHRV